MQADLYSELLSLERTNDSFFIYVKANSLAITDDEVKSFAGTIAGNDGVNGFAGTIAGNNDLNDAADEAGNYNAVPDNQTESGIGPYLLYRDPMADTTIEFSGEAQPDLFDTVCGSTEYIGVSNFAAIYLNGDESNNLLDMEEHYESDVQIIILDHDTGAVRSRLYYDHDADTFSLAGKVSE